jgi:hypothetical protein
MKTWTLRLALLGAVWTVGCGGAGGSAQAPDARPMDYVVSVDPSLATGDGQTLSANILPQIQAAAASWEQTIPGLTLAVVVRTCQAQGASEICLVSGSPSEEQACGGDAVGCEQPQSWGGQGAGIFLDVLRTQALGQTLIWNMIVQGTVAHELGHAFGCEHIEAGDLMAPVLSSQATGPQAADVADFYAHH